MKVGDRVRITDDEYEQLIGAEGVLRKFSPDGTAAIVEFKIPVWCSVANLVVCEEQL